MNKLSDRLSGKFHITVNVALLCVAIIASIAGIIERVLQSASTTTSFPVSLVTNVLALLSILIIIGTFYILYRQVMVAKSDRDFLASISGSALLGSILLGLTAISLTDSTSRSQQLGGAAIIALGLVSLLFLMIYITTRVPITENTPTFPPNGTPNDPVGPQSPTFPPNTPSYSRRPLPSSLPPPFTNDPLFRVPVLEDPLLPISGQPSFRVFSIPKPGEYLNEDACSISRDQTRFALCDGASGSALSRSWASLVGQQWLRVSLNKDNVGKLAQWLEGPRIRWRQWVRDYWLRAVNERNEITGDSYVQNKEVNEILSEGAATTFLGVHVDRENARWRATAIGDTCLFLVSSNPKSIKAIMPLTEASMFNLHPPLLNSSINSDPNTVAPMIVFHQQKYRPGEYLLLATDALAEWLIRQEKGGGKEWQELLTIPMYDIGSFSRFVEERRERNQITEDDTTLVIIQL